MDEASPPDVRVVTGTEREVLEGFLESARHAGHADILREQTDGRTGFD